MAGDVEGGCNGESRGGWVDEGDEVCFWVCLDGLGVAGANEAGADDDDVELFRHGLDL